MRRRRWRLEKRCWRKLRRGGEENCDKIGDVSSEWIALFPDTLMTPEFQHELWKLIEANRERALWSLARDYTPETPAAARRVLEQIAARGDRATFIRARQLLRQLD